MTTAMWRLETLIHMYQNTRCHRTYDSSVDVNILCEPEVPYIVNYARLKAQYPGNLERMLSDWEKEIIVRL
jgi:hypothetical protein